MIRKRLPRTAFVLTLAGSLLALPSGPASAGLEDPPPVITSVEYHPNGGELTKIYIDWGTHIDAPQGVLQDLNGYKVSDPANMTTVSDDTSSTDSGPESYRPGACYANCDSILDGDATIVWGEWFRPDVSDALQEAPPSVTAAWVPGEHAIEVSVDPAAHPDAPAFAFYRNDEFVKLAGGSARAMTDVPYGQSTVRYSARACYSDCVPVTVESGFAQQTALGSRSVVTEERPPIETSILVHCDPQTVDLDGTARCGALVQNDEFYSSPPEGIVAFTSDAGTFSPQTCQVFGPDSECSVLFAPGEGAGGDLTISARYAGSETHLPSDGETILVVRRPTTTTLTCSPSTVVVGTPTECVASLTDTATAAPLSGSLALSKTLPGTLSATSCQVDEGGTCRFSFTPAYFATGVGHVSASFAGDDTHAASAASFALEMARRPSITTIHCTPNPVPVTGQTWCTGTVRDANPPAEVRPTGDLTIEISDSTFSVRQTCRLQGDECTVVLTPPTGAVGSHTVRATYAGSTIHLGSEGSTTLAVGRAPTNLSARPAVADTSTPTPTLELSAFLESAVTRSPLPNAVITFRALDMDICTATTGADGVATCEAPTALLLTVLNAGYEADFAGDEDYLPSTSHGTLVE